MLFPSRATVGQASKAPIWNIWCKATTVLDIYLFFHQNGVTFLCVRLWTGPRVYFSLSFSLSLSLSLSLSSFCWWTGLVILEGEFCGSSFNILEIEEDSKCIFFSLSHWRTGIITTVLIPVKLHPWFLSLRLKTCLWAELQPWCLSLQWKTCTWAEHSDDDILIFLGDLLAY